MPALTRWSSACGGGHVERAAARPLVPDQGERAHRRSERHAAPQPPGSSVGGVRVSGGSASGRWKARLKLGASRAPGVQLVARVLDAPQVAPGPDELVDGRYTTVCDGLQVERRVVARLVGRLVAGKP